MPDINTHGLTLDFGKHRGELVTRVPVSYLRWMANAMTGERAEIAKAELERRGSVIPEIEISGHAIDRASLACRKIWHHTRGNDEGLHAWLMRVAIEAREKGAVLESGKVLYLGMKFVFEDGNEFPALKTVMAGTRNQRHRCGVVFPGEEIEN